MQTSANRKEREDFEKVHTLLNIDPVAPADSITNLGVHSVVPPKTPQQEDDGTVQDPELDRLNQGLQAITEDFWKRNLKTSYQTQFQGKTNKLENNPDKVKDVAFEVLGGILNVDALDYVANKLNMLGD